MTTKPKAPGSANPGSRGRTAMSFVLRIFGVGGALAGRRGNIPNDADRRRFRDDGRDGRGFAVEIFDNRFKHSRADAGAFYFSGFQKSAAYFDQVAFLSHRGGEFPAACEL